MSSISTSALSLRPPPRGCQGLQPLTSNRGLAAQQGRGGRPAALTGLRQVAVPRVLLCPVRGTPRGTTSAPRQGADAAAPGGPCRHSVGFCLQGCRACPTTARALWSAPGDMPYRDARCLGAPPYGTGGVGYAGRARP